jgi:hypothetical protein
MPLRKPLVWCSVELRSCTWLLVSSREGGDARCVFTGLVGPKDPGDYLYSESSCLITCTTQIEWVSVDVRV